MIRRQSPRRARISPPRVRRRMTICEWCGDRWDARVTGRAGIPAADTLELAPTGRQSVIYRRADQDAARWQRWAHIVTETDQAELARIDEVRHGLKSVLADAGAAIERAVAATPTDRLPAEATVPDVVIAGRRRADAARAAGPARAQAAAARGELDELSARAAELDETIRLAWREARAAVVAVTALANRREAAYWSRLVLRHPEGARLAARFDHPRVDLPAWVTDLDCERTSR